MNNHPIIAQIASGIVAGFFLFMASSLIYFNFIKPNYYKVFGKAKGTSRNVIIDQNNCKVFDNCNDYYNGTNN